MMRLHEKLPAIPAVLVVRWGHLRPCRALAMSADAPDGPTAPQAFLRCPLQGLHRFSVGRMVGVKPCRSRRCSLVSTPSQPGACACPPRPWHGDGRPGRQDLGKVLMHEVHVVNQSAKCARGAAASELACYFLQVDLAFTGRVLPGDRRECEEECGPLPHSPFGPYTAGVAGNDSVRGRQANARAGKLV